MNQQQPAPDAVESFLQESGLAARLKGASPDEIARLRQQIADRLEAIAKAAPEDEEGGTKIVVGRWSIRITGTVWPLAVCLVKLGIAAHDPTGLSWGEAAKDAIELLDKLAAEIHRLDPTERLVCAAIADKRRENKAAGVTPDGATRQDIAAFFTHREEQTPPTLDDILKKLAEKKILAAETDAKRGVLYRVTF